MIKIISVMAVVFITSFLQDQTKQPAAVNKGKLFIIGGGEIGDSLRRKILTTANWKKGDVIAAITLASGLGD